MKLLSSLIKSIENWESLSYAEIASKLNEPELIKNPEPRGKVAKGIPNMLTCISLIKPEETQTVLANAPVVAGGLDGLRKIFNLEASVTTPEFQVFILEKLGLSKESVDAIMAYGNEPIDDPNYEEWLKGDSLAQKEGWGVISSADVQRAILWDS